MSEKRLSERMSDTTHAVNEAQDALQVAITRAVNFHFDAGIEFERDRILKDLQAACRCNGEQTEGYYCEADWAIKIVNQYWKKEQK